jgi:hypothetical protein
MIKRDLHSPHDRAGNGTRMEQQRTGVHWGGPSRARERTPPEGLDVDVVATLESVGDERRLTRVQLSARGRVPGADGDAFAGAVRRAKEQLVSRARSDSVVISAAAVLEPDVAVEHVDL